MASIVFFGLCALGFGLSISYVAEREAALKWLVILGLAAIDLLLLPFGLLYLLMPLLPGVSDAIAESTAFAGVGGAWIVGRLPWFGALAMATGTIGLLLLLPPVRRLVARVLPIDPGRTVHLTALHYALFLTSTSLLLPVFLPPLEDEALLEELSGTMAGGGLSLLWGQAFGFVALAFLGVGLVVARDWREALSRLGLTARYDLRWWLGGTAVALASSVVVDTLWGRFGSESLEQVQRLSEALFEPYLQAGLLGAITIGLSAGLGEEILFRGAIQPRLGLIFTTLLFAVVHTQYTISPALLQVFVVGLILGLARRRANTTTAIGIHATYNLVLALLMIYAPDLAP